MRVNTQGCKSKIYYEALRKHIPNMILHEISNLTLDSEAKIYEDDVEEDRKMLKTMDEFFKNNKKNIGGGSKMG